MRTKDQTKGVFCLEGLWENDLRRPSSVRPILDLLENCRYIPNVYRDFATREEFDFYLRKWCQRTYDPYPILYLATHGTESGLCLGRDEISLDDVAEIIEGQCANRVVIFGSCSVMNVDKRHLKRFLRQTGALAVCGYRLDVDWLKSTAFELLLLSEMQDNEFSGRGIDAIETRAEEIGRMFRELEFRMVTYKEAE